MKITSKDLRSLIREEFRRTFDKKVNSANLIKESSQATFVKGTGSSAGQYTVKSGVYKIEDLHRDLAEEAELAERDIQSCENAVFTIKNNDGPLLAFVSNGSAGASWYQFDARRKQWSQITYPGR